VRSTKLQSLSACCTRYAIFPADGNESSPARPPSTSVKISASVLSWNVRDTRPSARPYTFGRSESRTSATPTSPTVVLHEATTPVTVRELPIRSTRISVAPAPMISEAGGQGRGAVNPIA
jgi:hypothetical protein